jgi:ArsR family metal-binding transcriptional regulator
MQRLRYVARMSAGIPVVILVDSSKVVVTRFGKLIKKLHGLSPRANYTDRETAVCRQSDCQLLRIEGATWSA